MKIIKTLIGVGPEDSFFLHFFYEDGAEAFLTVDRRCHVLSIPSGRGAAKEYGDDVTPYEAFRMLTGHRAEDVLESLDQTPHSACTESKEG